MIRKWASEITGAGVAFYSAIGTLGGAVTFLIGEWSKAIAVFIAFMIIDYVTGVLLALTKKSPKSEDGGYSSKVGLRGIAKKAGMFIIVIVAHCFDYLFDTQEVVRQACLIALIVNEGFSIIENLKAMGVPIPDYLVKVISALKKKPENQTMTEELISDEEEKNEESEETNP